MIYFWVMLGSALGGGARYWFSGLAAHHFGETFPWGTLIVNVTRLVRHRLLLDPHRAGRARLRRLGRTPIRDDRHLRRLHHLFFLQPQTLNLVRDGEMALAGANIGLSFLFCLLAVWARPYRGRQPEPAQGSLIHELFRATPCCCASSSARTPNFSAARFTRRSSSRPARSHLAGATVLRGPMGFGHSSRLHTSKILRLSEDLPLVIEIVDTEEKIKAFLPTLDAMMPSGLVTLEKVQVLLYGQEVKHAPA